MTPLAASSVTTHTPRPAHAPLQPTKVEPAAGAAGLHLPERRMKEALHWRARHPETDICFVCDEGVEECVGSAKIHLFRIVQEAVHNAIRHGEARAIGIRLTKAKTQIVLEIRDDGVGLPAPGTRKPGMGLRFMAYRAGILGGSLVVRQERTGGTTVECRVRLAGGNRPRPGERKPKPGIARPNSLKRRPQ